MKTLANAIAFLWVSLVAVECARAADVDSELRELRQRIEALEGENKSLRQSTQAETPASDGPQLSLNTANTADQLNDKPTESIVEPHIKELEAELAATCPPPDEKGDDLTMSAKWNHGIEFTSKDKAFRVHIGGRTQLDTSWYAVDQNVQDNIDRPYQDGVDFRRGRIRLDGTMYYTMDWAVEYDFFNSFPVSGDRHTVTGPTDLWWTFREVPAVGNVRIGNQKPPIGFEHLVSSRFLPFMERSFDQDAFYGGFYNGFLPGITCFDNWGQDDMGLWQLGLFKNTNNVFGVNANNGDAAVVGRLTRLLWYECDGASLLHVGGSLMAHNTVNGQIAYRTRDAIRAGLSSEWPIPASTGVIAGDDGQWINGEVAAVNGPWTFQSEYIVSRLEDAAAIVGNVVQPSVGTVSYQGGYAQVLYFLTGEHDNYNKATGVFDRVIPNNNFYFRRDCVGSGPGAWQIGARYNFLDLNDESLNGGILHNVTCGLNWFLNPNFKFQFDYMATHRDAPLAGNLGDGWIHGFGIRTAHDF